MPATPIETPDAVNDAVPPRDEKTQRLIEQFFDRVGEVSTLPSTALRVIEVANSPGFEIADLYDVVQTDPALALRILRTVNSSYYSLRNQVKDLRMGITLLGYKEVRNLALTIYVSQLFKSSAGHGNYRREDLWNHCVSVGATSRFIAKSYADDTAESIYLAGLLHDVGLILEDQHIHQPFCKLLDTLSDQQPTTQTEAELFGFDHTELGYHMAHRWKLPPDIAASIRYHHSPDDYDGEHRRTVCLVSVANYLCSARGITSLGVNNTPIPPQHVFAEIGIGTKELGEIWGQLDEVHEQASKMLPGAGAQRSS